MMFAWILDDFCATGHEIATLRMALQLRSQLLESRDVPHMTTQGQTGIACEVLIRLAHLETVSFYGGFKPVAEIGQVFVSQISDEQSKLFQTTSRYLFRFQFI